MVGSKHIETCVAGYIAANYRHAVEIGIGRNTHAAAILAREKKLLGSTDIRPLPDAPAELHFFPDDIFEPELERYRGADVLYAIRPGPEMIPPLIALAKAAGCDLIVYHLGFESYGDGGEKIDCGVILHRYYRNSEPVEQG